MKRNSTLALVLGSLSLFIYQCKVTKPSEGVKKDAAGNIIVNPHPSPAYLSPKEGLKSIQVPEGYKLQLVASEPMIKEPVAIVWDGEARMYVAEMSTYMQDINGTGQHKPVCRISLLEDTNGDGTMDKSTVFIDSLVLPRMMLCVGHKLLVNETWTYNIHAYSDTNGDGKADTKELVYENNKPDTRNLEHQKSGLVWNLDNWIYVSCDPVRYKYVGGKLAPDSLTNSPGGQWGLGNDDYGRLYFSSAGAEIPALGFQVNPAYGFWNPNDQYNQDFLAVWPIIATPDVQGGMNRLRPDTTLNHFTASCGQSIFRGNALPEDMKGDLLICEPVGRLIRRAKVSEKDGKVFLRNAYDKKEFITSYDMNFRPVNTTTGPDGCLYIVDMYRGIIQEATWTAEGSFLRPRILAKGLDKNIQRGRIYRLVHEGYKPGPKPHMLDVSSATLLTYLDHPNGWWRDNAQKEIIAKGDMSVVPALKEIAAGKHATIGKSNGALARIHALWTLEGLKAIDKPTLFTALADTDPQVRKTAVWISEVFLKQNDKEVISKLAAMKNDVAAVQIQAALSLSVSDAPEAKAAQTALVNNSVYSDALHSVANATEVNHNTKLFGSRLANMPAHQRNMILNGANIYKQLCSTCHGPDGKGIIVGGGSAAAPPFVGSKRVSGDKELLTKILLNGLTGPIDGKTYTDVMAPLGAVNSDEWVASVLSYVRYNFGRFERGKSPVVDIETVKKVRETVRGRDKFWTLEELEK
ncbi:mono/diheme cytochrome c family protein/glucose/arabinose dehydrogenase [Chitinophaga terrae (ex Kim and Jung 2007)]|uniref:DUF7133 domain-containing protein n=1 Tax=Chitinophaga terrae (ex Kim and Jung 2007) TaxID=408074 RepID=UPI00278128FC|nr:c-type cytochrome [Chitinophaga terrae (ex Kim and Jung 2007)]MDQ0106833.1 mono/diheme cytochrome c family protein/glucose/arabinose dehydrogenase [Chitinophaga terrae (ex Kim and Jung 2007)]